MDPEHPEWGYEFHAWPAGDSLGYAGLDVFLVAAGQDEGFAPAELSGYLISQISALAAADAVRDSGGNLQAHWASARVYGQRQAQMERALGRDWGVRLAEALEIDLACKGRSPVEPWVALERWLLRAALPPARAARFAA